MRMPFPILWNAFANAAFWLSLSRLLDWVFDLAPHLPQVHGVEILLDRRSPELVMHLAMPIRPPLTLDLAKSVKLLRI